MEDFFYFIGLLDIWFSFIGIESSCINYFFRLFKIHFFHYLSNIIFHFFHQSSDSFNMYRIIEVILNCLCFTCLKFIN